MSHKTTEPFRAVCFLRDGRINSADGLLYLDSILYHAWFAKYAPHVLQGLSNDYTPPHFGLPLTQLPNNRYAASCGFYTQYDTQIEYWNKRPDFLRADAADYFDPGRATKINTSSGQERAYHMPNVIRLVGPIEFYGVGTIAKIRELLSLIPAVGKKPSAGWGIVERWEVEPWTEDWSTWSDRHGLMRPMPVGGYDGDDAARYAVRDVAIRPPAWKVINWATCYVPEVATNA